MEAQKQVYGYNFIQELLPDKIVKDMQNSLPMQIRPGGVETIEYLFAQYVINRQITASVRTADRGGGQIRPGSVYAG